MHKPQKTQLLTASLAMLLSALFFAGCDQQHPPDASKEPLPQNEDATPGQTQEKKETEQLPNELPPLESETAPQEGFENTPDPDYKVTGGEVALVTDLSSVMDDGFNQAIFEGLMYYSDAAGVSYSYYSASRNDQADYDGAVLRAIEDGARLVVCGGAHFDSTVGLFQDKFPDIHFLMVSGIPKDEKGNALPISPNVHCISLHQEQAGYLAGYLAVLDGYRELGFIGGEKLPTVIKYCHGYLQGASDAAIALDIPADVSVRCWYSGTFNPSPEIERISREWYEDGTQVIFACGGSIYQSILKSAEQWDGLLIGMDVDQSHLSKRFLTSAMDGLQRSVIIALDDYYANGKKWDEEQAGQIISYGAEHKCVELPTSDEAWRFENATVDDYAAILRQLRDGTVQVSDETATPPDVKINVYWTED